MRNAEPAGGRAQLVLDHLLPSFVRTLVTGRTGLAPDAHLCHYHGGLSLMYTLARTRMSRWPLHPGRSVQMACTVPPTSISTISVSVSVLTAKLGGLLIRFL